MLNRLSTRLNSYADFDIDSTPCLTLEYGECLNRAQRYPLPDWTSKLPRDLRVLPKYWCWNSPDLVFRSLPSAHNPNYSFPYAHILHMVSNLEVPECHGLLGIAINLPFRPEASRC